MKLWEKILQEYPEIDTNSDFRKLGIYLTDDGDGVEYISEWTYTQPIPDGLTLGKPSA